MQIHNNHENAKLCFLKPLPFLDIPLHFALKFLQNLKRQCVYIYIYMALAYFALLETQKDRSYQRSYLRGETVMGWATIQQQKKKVAAESFF